MAEALKCHEFDLIGRAANIPPASKTRGMWVGGTPPLGYESDGRTLAIVEDHANLVRDIYRHYLETGNVRLMADELDRENILSPVRARKLPEQI